MGSRHGRRLPPCLPRARARGPSHRAHVPRRRRGCRAAERGGARARRLRRQGLRAQAAPPLRERAGPQAEARTEARAAARPPEGRAEGRRRPLRGRDRARGQAPQRAGLARVRSARGRDGLPQRLRSRQGREPDQEPAARAAGRQRGALQAVPALPPSGPRRPGRRPDAAHEPGPAGPRGRARRLLEGRPEHPRRRRVPGRQHPAPRPLPRRRGLQRLHRLRRQGAAAGEEMAREARRARRTRTPAVVPARARCGCAARG